MMQAEYSFITLVMIVSCTAIGLSGLMEGGLYFYTRSPWLRDWVDLPVTGDWYSFGNHFRNLPVFFMMSALSGALQEGLEKAAAAVNK